MKVKDLIKKLQALKPELQDKEIVVVAKNETYQEPHIRLDNSYIHNGEWGKWGVNKVVLYWE